MARLFGTDGVRGVANTQLTCDLAFKLGQAAVAFQGKTILIGKDTRLSGDMLESAVAAGIMSMGGTALLAGIIPTPAIALLVRELLPDCPEAAAALADKLGCREASFRTAGGTQPFGMAKSLDGTPLPQRAYLGPAFE